MLASQDTVAYMRAELSFVSLGGYARRRTGRVDDNAFVIRKQAGVGVGR